MFYALGIRPKNSELSDEQFSTSFQTDKTEDEQPVKKKRGRKPKSELKVNKTKFQPKNEIKI